MVRCEQDIRRLTGTLAALSSKTDAYTQHKETARAALQRAEERLNAYQKKRVPTRWASSGATYATILADLQTASEELVYSQPEDELMSIVSELTGAVRTYLGIGDMRREAYLTYLHNVSRTIDVSVPKIGAAGGVSAADDDLAETQ
jgi:hypothetical protein